MWNATLDWAQLDPLHMYTHTYAIYCALYLHMAEVSKLRSKLNNRNELESHVACEFTWLVSCWLGMEVWVGEGDEDVTY